MARSITFSSQIAADEVEPFFAIECDFSGSIESTWYVTVMQTGDGNRFAVNQAQQQVITVARGNTIKFDQTDSSNSGHPIELSLTEDGSDYTTGWSYTGTAGSDGIGTWVVPGGAPDELYLKCNNHTDMGMLIEVVDPQLRAWTGYGNITIDSDTYIGLGDFGSISNVKQGERLTADGLTLGLSGIPTEILTGALQEDYQGRDVIIYFGCLVSGQLTLAPYELFSGRMDQMTISQGGETSNISLTVENQLIDMQRARISRWTDDDQQSKYASDVSLRYVSGLQEKEVLWGVPFSSIPATVGTIDLTNAAEAAAALVSSGNWKPPY